MEFEKQEQINKKFKELFPNIEEYYVNHFSLEQEVIPKRIDMLKKIKETLE